LHITEEGGPGGEMALRYGRELTGIEMAGIRNEHPAIAVVGEGGGSPSSPEGRWVIADFFAGSAPMPGADQRIIALPEVRTSDETTTAAAALTQRRTVALSPVKLRLWLNPKVEPGMRLELADMPDNVPLGECRVRHIVSTWVPGGAMFTDVWASGNTAGASDLLGSLAGAIGSVL
jgi:hypothetical protein